MAFGERPAARRRGRGRRNVEHDGADNDERDAGADTGEQADPHEVARTIALRLLDRRDYTRAELAERLARRDVPAEVAESVLDRFEEVRLLDDQRYAERYAVSRQSSRSLSRSAVRRELLGKGIDADLADEAVGAIDDDTERDTALEFARRKARPMAGLPREKQYRRLAGALARKGYASGLVNSTVQVVLAELAEQEVADDMAADEFVPDEPDVDEPDVDESGVEESGSDGSGETGSSVVGPDEPDDRGVGGARIRTMAADRTGLRTSAPDGFESL